MGVTAAQQEKVEIDSIRLLELIPHRYPFLMVDRLIDVVSGLSATGIKNVSGNEPFFQGHFPERPVMPGVLLIESMAQTAAALVVHSLGPAAEGKLVYFLTVDNARFRKPVLPGDTMHVYVTKLRTRGNIWRFSGETRVEGTITAEATFSAMILDD